MNSSRGLLMKGIILAFGDPDHHHLDPYEFVSHPVIIRTLAEAGYGVVAIEAPLFLQSLIDLYRDRKISRAAFVTAADTFFDNAFVDDELYLNLLADLINNAKKANMRVYAVDSAPGMISRENAKEFHDITSKMAILWAKKLTSNPKILKQTKQEQEQTMGLTVISYIRDYVSLVQKEQLQQKMHEKTGSDLTERYRHDKETATTIKELRRKGKVAIIFGNLHFERNDQDRMNGDIDYHLGEENVTTINLYYDLEIYKSGNDGELWRRMADPKSKPVYEEDALLWRQLRGVADRPEYEVDLKRGRWLDWSAKKETLFMMPDKP